MYDSVFCMGGAIVVQHCVDWISESIVMVIVAVDVEIDVKANVINVLCKEKCKCSLTTIPSIPSMTFIALFEGCLSCAYHTEYSTLNR